MPLNTDINLVRVADVMQELNAPDTDYLKVERLVNAASARLEKECGLFFKQRTETFVLHGNGNTILDMPGPIISITSVTMDPDTTAPTLLTVLTDYRVLTDRGQLYRYGGWSYGVQNIQVVAVVGMADADIPDEIRHACMELVKYYYKTETTGDFQSERLGDYSYTRFDVGTQGIGADLPAVVKGIIMGGNRRWSV